MTSTLMMMKTEETSEKLVFNSTLTRLIAKKDFGAFWHFASCGWFRENVVLKFHIK
jgi:hypothetical protein